MKSRLFIFSILTFALAIPSIANAADATKGKTLFTTRCGSCHGNEGKGDGPAAAALPAESKPRNLADGAFKIATDDTKMKDLLKKGGAALGLSPLMPPAAGLSDEDLDNIIAFVHSLKK